MEDDFLNYNDITIFYLYDDDFGKKRSELQSLANQTAYNVSQLLDNLLQVMVMYKSYIVQIVQIGQIVQIVCADNVDDQPIVMIVIFAMQVFKNSPRQ